MKATIEYAAVKAYTASLEIEDIGNTCIRGRTEESAECYMFIKTIAGFTTILTVGPVLPGLPILCKNFKVESQQCKYSEKTIMKNINSFLNTFGKIESAEVISFSEGLANFPDIVDILSNLS